MASYNWWLACLFITDIFFLGDTENNGAPPLTPWESMKQGLLSISKQSMEDIMEEEMAVIHTPG